MTKLMESTINAPLEFSPSVGELTRKTRAVGAKIGWLHAQSDQEGASFDLTIKDALGRIKLQKKNCTSDTKEYGELVNLETMIGEDLEVSVSNVKGAEKIQVFLN